MYLMRFVLNGFLSKKFLERSIWDFGILCWKYWNIYAEIRKIYNYITVSIIISVAKWISYIDDNILYLLLSIYLKYGS